MFLGKMLSVIVINKNRLNYLALKLQRLRYQANFSADSRNKRFPIQAASRRDNFR
jgi:hypothetical protein